MKKCCKYHENVDGMGTPCGMAGMGDVLLCCPDCPEKPWYNRNQPTRVIEYRNDPTFFERYDRAEFRDVEEK